MAKKQEEYNWDNHDGPSGYENSQGNDFSIPYLSICQKGSAEFDKDHKDHEAKAITDIIVGDIFDTRTREILKQPLKVVPAHYVKLYQEWKTRKAGGGFVKSHASPAILTQTMRNEKNEDILPNGNVITTTSYFYVFYWCGLDWVKAVLPMTSTQLKKARKWLDVMDTQRSPAGVRLPMFSTEYVLTTNLEQNADGTWYGWGYDKSRRLNKGDADLIQDCSQASKEIAQSQGLLAESSAE